jgi:hypothetical protein
MTVVYECHYCLVSLMLSVIMVNVVMVSVVAPNSNPWTWDY